MLNKLTNAFNELIGLSHDTFYHACDAYNLLVPLVVSSFDWLYVVSKLLLYVALISSSIALFALYEFDAC
jgi:hypothetical protein